MTDDDDGDDDGHMQTTLPTESTEAIYGTTEGMAWNNILFPFSAMPSKSKQTKVETIWSCRLLPYSFSG